MHAAAGGVGQILCQWAKALGATVIGTVGSDEKAALAKKAGCKHVIVTSREKFVERVKEITKGKGVPVVYDGVGKDTFMGSLDCLAPLGLMASFGNASGAVTQFNPGVLAQKGSLFLTRPTLVTYTASREILVKRRAGAVRGGEERQGQDRDQPDLPVARSGAGAARSRGPQDDGINRVDPVTASQVQRLR